MAKEPEIKALPVKKQLPPLAVLAVVAVCLALFAVRFGLVDSSFSAYLPFIVLAVFGVYAVPVLRRTKIERYFEAVNRLHPEIKPLKKLKKLHSGEDTVYMFRMPAGMSKSQYETYKEGLEQYLDANVSISFDHVLKVTVSGSPPDKYK